MVTIVWSNEVAVMPKPGWLVEGLIPAADDGCCGILCGREGSYKSFLALDLAAHVSQSNETWMGRRIMRGGTVLYVAAERYSEMSKRLCAWTTQYNDGNAICNVGIVGHPLYIGESKTINDLTDAIDQSMPIPPKLMIVDTLAKCIPGVDENSAAEMGVVTANLDRLQRRYGMTILLIHHLNRAGQTRGSTALGAHVSFEIHTEKKPGLACELSCEKMSVGAEPDKIRIQMAVVETEFGDTLSVNSSATVVKEIKKPVTVEQIQGCKPRSSNERIVDYLVAVGVRLVPREISLALDMNDGTVRSALSRLSDEGRVRRDEEGRYRAVIQA